MRQRFIPGVLLVAALLTTGSQWDFVQMVAWARMAAANLRTMTLAEALEQAVTADPPCALCRAVRQARQQQPGSIPSSETLREKNVLVFEAVPAPVATVMDPEGWPRSGWSPSGVERRAPPVPPPRAPA